MIEEIDDMIKIILECPELFHDGINEDILRLLIKIKKYIEDGGEANV